MAVCNSWVEVYADGRKNTVATGPRDKGGRMHAAFRVRDDGVSVPSVSVETFAFDDGTLKLCVYDENNELIHTHTTHR